MAKPHPAELQIAALAHQLWCERMIAQGWRPGDGYDRAARIHDALVPFAQLRIQDKRDTALGVIALELIDTLGQVPDYVREGDGELMVAQLSKGMRVAFADEPSSQGTVISWVEDKDWPGFVETIAVRWDSGEVNEHAAAERELRPLN